MSVSTRSSLIMLDRCRIYSEHRGTEVCLIEPNDYETEAICTFAERAGGYDWINDTALFELLEQLFERKKRSEEP